MIADVGITSPAFVLLANYFISEIYNLFPCNIASAKHLGSWENTRRTLLVFSRFPACLDEAILHGNKLYISWILNDCMNFTQVSNVFSSYGSYWMPGKTYAEKRQVRKRKTIGSASLDEKAFYCCKSGASNPRPPWLGTPLRIQIHHPWSLDYQASTVWKDVMIRRLNVWKGRKVDCWHGELSSRAGPWEVPTNGLGMRGGQNLMTWCPDVHERLAHILKNELSCF